MKNINLNFARAAHFFVDFIAVITLLRREIPRCTVFIAMFSADVVVVVAKAPYCHGNPQLTYILC